LFNQIDLENRKKGDIHNDCLTTVDGTDFRIANWGRKFYSHKFKGSGLRYEVALSILGGDIVWIHGPFPAGAWNDITIFRDSLMSHLEDGERVEADDGYIGEAPRHVKCPMCFTSQEECVEMQQRTRNRQETVNNRFKMWGILREKFRHDLHLHADVFRAIAVMTQIAIDNGSRLFNVYYDDGHPGVDCGDEEVSL
jgi:hypothetical protein